MIFDAVLGKGGSAKVFLGHEGSKRCVIKQINKHKVPKAQWVADKTLGLEKVPIEVSILCQLQDIGKGLPKLVEHFETDEHYYLVTEFQDSVDLYAYLEHKTMTESQARFVMNQILELLARLEAFGIAHGDIKDENVLIDKNYQVSLIDFGSVCPINRKRPAKCFYGTIQYAPPEILLGQDYDPLCADIWSLGCLLYCLLTGKLPFDSTRHILERPHNPLPFTASSELQDLLSWMLEKDPGRRPSLDLVTLHPFLQRCPDTPLGR
ncbi:kinase-like domain-containing protein [Gorgonomyces haynaldii]|nr:kinase-like domain-containing protein [Gorgonomyces haynaldii]